MDAERTPEVDADPDPVALQRRARSRAATVQRRELQRVVTRVEATGSLSREQRRIVGSLAAAVVDGVLTVPETAAERAIEGDAAATAVLELFDAEE